MSNPVPHAIAWAGPAVFSNFMVTAYGGGMFRLAFLERSSDLPTGAFRCAVAITYPDLVSLHSLLGDAITNLNLKPEEAIQ